MTLSRAALAGLFLAVGISGCGKSSQQPTAPAVAPTELAALKTPPPEYSPQLACAGIGGTSVLRVVVGVEGTPTDVSVSQSSGQPVLDEAAQKRVREWKFRAATRNGQAVPQTIQVPVAFKPPVPRPDECFAIEERARRGG
ncbi:MULTISPECIES: energy transducer TonB [Xanthomonas]|jgi:protein TonB|uniref:Protein TonB n=1 Tax=Xanthomonas arboricola TaxID=56448 RepID=A0AB73GSI0_9XANT|nr:MULTISPECIES: energy transducer TonB [Xanthomonas]KER83534.1 energy transducer TonB [Xanthomonas arboricola pv. celebensis]MBB3796929.1 protein TonB [Xanthomonas arboricola]MBB4769212.1 protein TonB [Xanthomonas arboricola]MBB5669014.1 protein TonB [Xanthomonas arboricola]MXV48611.1 energy transducer TonB [Xanthomonas sp. LMG 8993]